MKEGKKEKKRERKKERKKDEIKPNTSGVPGVLRQLVSETAHKFTES